MSSLPENNGSERIEFEQDARDFRVTKIRVKSRTSRAKSAAEISRGVRLLQVYARHE